MQFPSIITPHLQYNYTKILDSLSNPVPSDVQIIILKEAAQCFGDEQIGFGGREEGGGSFCHSQSHFSCDIAAGLRVAAAAAASAAVYKHDGG